MSPICGVCHDLEAKYKCTKCPLKYCSILCYKTHAATHSATQPSAGNGNASEQQQATFTGDTAEKPPPLPAQLTTSNVRASRTRTQPDFSGFEDDPDFQRLLHRYPRLKHQLQLVYGVTLEPGHVQQDTWYREDYLKAPRDPSEGQRHNFRDRGRGRGRGRFQGRGRGRGRGRGGFHRPPSPEPSHPTWTQEKGDKQAIEVCQKFKDTGRVEDADGMDEFVELCQMKFGEK